MNDNTSSYKQFLILAGILVVYCLALYKYDQSHNTGTQAYQTLKKQNHTIQASNASLTAQVKAVSTTNATLSVKNTELLNEKSKFCAELSKAKVNDILCAK